MTYLACKISVVTIEYIIKKESKKSDKSWNISYHASFIKIDR